MALDKSSASEESGFLSRWSQRKQALRKGEALAEPEMPVNEVILDQKPVVAGVKSARSAPDLVVSKEPVKAEEKPPAPTMHDVHQLTPQSDFKPFMRTDVAPEVKNAAMKQLFKDPHFNVMDMMDTYVDDYSKPDPLPPEMLRKMAVTQFLGFWKEEEEAEEKAAAEKKAREDAGERADENVAQSVPENTTPETTLESQAPQPEAVAMPHDNPDLQLQPDDAARRESARPSAG
jgi:Protein of unknown function (DUF3306)